MRISLLFILGLLFHTSTAWAQPVISLQGTVQTADGNPAEAVTISLKGKSQGALTDQRGHFVIHRVKPGTYLLQASAIGLKAVEQTITVTGTEPLTVNFSLAESTAQLNEVTVNASRINRFARPSSDYVSKMPLKNLENAQVYSSIGKELLTEQLVFSVDDAMRNAPGIQKMWNATGRSGDGGAYYNTRGFIVQSQLRNGLAGNITSSIDAVNLEKLEVIKGPSATLFGSALTSYGGLVNRVTKKPYETVGGEVVVSGGSYNFQRVSVDVNTPLNKNRTVLFRLNSALNHTGTFQTEGFNKSFALAPSLLLKPTNRLSILLDAEIYRVQNVVEQTFFFYVPGYTLGATRADQLRIDYSNSYMGDGLSQKSRSTNLFGQINYRLSPAFTSSTNISSSHSYSNGFGPYFYILPDGKTLGSNLLVRADQSTRNSTNDVFQVQQLFNGDFRLGKLRNRVVLGLDYLHTNAKQLFFGSTYDTVPITTGYDYSSFNGSALTTLYAQKTPDFTYPLTGIQNTYSAFVSDVLNLTDQLSVLAAVRVDAFHNQGGTAGSEIKGYNQTALSPKFGIVFQPIKDQVSLFANYQNSFTNRGVYNAYDPTATDSLTQKFATLEQANQFEAGIKLNTFEGRLTTTLSYYNIQVNNLLRTDPNPLAAARFAQTQDGTQLSRGIELDVIANPLKGVNVVAGFAYNDSKLTKADADVNGRRPTTASSPIRANLWLSYRFTSYALRGLGFGIGGNYASDNKIQNSISLGEFILPAYTVLNASAFYEQPRYRISAKVDNFTNQRYWIGYTTMDAQPLRSVAASVAYKF